MCSIINDKRLNYCKKWAPLLILFSLLLIPIAIITFFYSFAYPLNGLLSLIAFICLFISQNLGKKGLIMKHAVHAEMIYGPYLQSGLNSISRLSKITKYPKYRVADDLYSLIKTKIIIASIDYNNYLLQIGDKDFLFIDMTDEMLKIHCPKCGAAQDVEHLQCEFCGANLYKN